MESTLISRLSQHVSKWNARHPVWFLVLVSWFAVVINCHPVVFGGRSMVSPASTGVMVYSWLPLFPGLQPGQTVSAHGSDTGATMLYEVPSGFIEYRSLQQGELPLWNRYGHAGQPFFGQAITMLGDPLHLIVLLGHGSALAWDVKFLTAKFLFCFGFGLLVWHLLGSQRLALLHAALAAWCGAFFYINNHPVFFVFAYSPWILLSALKWLDPQNGHWFRWGLVWLLANFASFNAGHVEVAVIMIGGLNSIALLHCLLACPSRTHSVKVLARLTVGTLLFGGFTAPVWVSFLTALQGAYSGHMEAHVYQLPLRSLPGVFDDLLYLLLVPGDAYPALAPCTGLLVLAGCILSLRHWKLMKTDRFFWINLGAIMLWGGCVFGWVPAGILNHIPFLNRDGHTYTDFSYLLVIHLTLQSAYGFRSLTQAPDRRRVLEFSVVILLMAGMLLWYDFSITHRPVPWFYFVCTTAGRSARRRCLFCTSAAAGKSPPPDGWPSCFWDWPPNSASAFMPPAIRISCSWPAPGWPWMHAAPRSKKSSRIKPVRSGWWACCTICTEITRQPMVWKTFVPCSPLTSGDYMDLMQSHPGLEFPYTWVMLVTNAVAAQPLLNLLNVKYLLGPTGIVLSAGSPFRIAGRSDFSIIENPQAWPRAFFSDQVVSIASTSGFIQELDQQGDRPFVALAPAEMEICPALRQLETNSSPVIVAATHYDLRFNSTAFDLHAPAAGVVCLTEGQARDFVATANGEIKPVLTVNRAFKGVYLDHPGDYHIQFTYRPRYWHQACLLFWLAAAGLVILLIAHLIQRRQNH